MSWAGERGCRSAPVAGRLGECGLFEGGVDRGGGTCFSKGEAVGEGFDEIDISCTGKLFAALAEAGEDGDVAADDVFEIDLGAGVVLVADGDGRAGDVFEAGVLDPELVGVAGIDGDGGGDVFDVGADDGETGFVLFDGGLRSGLRRWNRAA